MGDSSRAGQTTQLAYVCGRGPVLIVERQEVARQLAIIGFVSLVQDEVDEIKSRDEGGWQVNIVNDRQTWVVSRADGVGTGQHTGSRIERGNNACLSNADCLLLHHLVQLHMALEIRALICRKASSNP